MSACIVSVGVGHWYARGVSRLERSLIHHGWDGGMMMWKDEYPPGSPSHQEFPYAFKLAAIRHARDAGHHTVLWLDASAWAVGNPLPVIQKAREQGHYFWTSGHVCGQWCNDRCLEYFGITREEAMSVPMLYAICMGLDFRNECTRSFFDQWQQALNAGIFNGSWEDHRHDQSAASLIAHKLGMSIDGTHTLCHSYQPQLPEGVVLTFQGL